MSVEPEWASVLRRLALNDDRTIDSVLHTEAGENNPRDLGDKARSLVRLAALIATESAAPSYQRAVGLALSTGATEDEVVGVLLSVAAIVGTARVISAAPDLALALGYDVDQMYET